MSLCLRIITNQFHYFGKRYPTEVEVQSLWACGSVETYWLSTAGASMGWWGYEGNQC